MNYTKLAISIFSLLIGLVWLALLFYFLSVHAYGMSLISLIIVGVFGFFAYSDFLILKNNWSK